MKQNFLPKIKSAFLLLILLLGGLSMYAQTTISSYPSNNNGSSVIVFSIQNNNTYDITINEIGSLAGGTATYSAFLYALPATYNVAPGVAPNITAANGWTVIGSNLSLALTANTSTTATSASPFITGLNYTVPAMTHVRLCLQLATGANLSPFTTNAGSIRYSDITTGACTISGGGVDMIYCADYGYGGIVTAVTNTPRRFIGYINFEPAIPCTNPPPAGTITSSAPTAVCPNTAFNIPTTGTAIGSGLTFQWQSATAATGPWTDIAGANSPAYTNSAGITTATYYRLKSECSGGGAVYSPAHGVTISPITQCYCTPPSPSYTDLYYIQNVTTTGGTTNISNLATGFSAGGYGNFVSQIVSATQSTSFNFNIQSQNGASAGIKIWIDWNQNGVFDANELEYNSSAGSSSTLNTYTGTINVPLTAVTGNTRMRIRNYTGQQPCNQLSYGETEDYTVNVIALAPCVGPPTPGVASVSAATVCNGQTINLNLTGNSLGSGQTYQWKRASAIAGPWTNVGTAQTTPMLSSVSPTSGTNYYQCELVCGTTSSLSTIDSVIVPAAFPAGTYTINPSGTGTNNFTTFAAAVSAISCGIAGPVIFNVSPGTYNEQINIPATIATTATNTVTFNGGGATLTQTITSAGTDYTTLNLDGADYITFKNLNIEALGTSNGFAVHLMNGADHNTFKNCNITASITNTATTSAAFVMSGSRISATTTGANGSHNLIDSCTITGGYYGVQLYGDALANNTNNVISNSTVKDFYYYGIYFYNQDNTLIKNNIVERPIRTNSGAAYGIYLATNTKGTVEKNKVRNLFGSTTNSTSTVYCLYNGTSGASATNPNKWINNEVSDIRSNGSIYGIYSLGYNNVQFYHNTLSFDDANSTAGLVYGAYAYGAGTELKNNNISITRGGSGAKYCLYFSSTGTATSNNNNLYINSPAGTNGIGYFNTSFATLAAWQGANSGAWDQNSVAANPMFVAPATGNFAPSNAAINDFGAALGITTDITGATRSATTPDMGAYEFTVAPCTGTPVAGTAFGVDSVCANVAFTVNDTSATNAGGITYQWQSSPYNANTWSNITGANSMSLSVPTGITVPTDYRLLVTCTASGLNATSNVHSVGINPISQCYCIPPVPTYNTLYWIDNVTTTGGTTNISNLATGMSTNGYGNYTSHVVSSAPNDSFAFNVQSQNGASPGLKIWIDWDQSGTFDTGELVYSSTAGASSSLNTYTGTIVVPATAVIGNTRMRIRNYTGQQPCNQLSYGETEDYTVHLGIPCTTPNVNLGADKTICNGASTTLDAGTFAGATYTWSTGASTQTISVNTPGVYWVSVSTGTNCVGTDTIQVGTSPMPTGNGINITNNTPSFDFYVAGAQNTNTYTWNFGDNSPTENGSNVSHTYTTNGVFTVTVVLSNDCGSITLTENVTVTGVGINKLQLDADVLKLYPNPANNSVNLVNESNFKMKHVTVSNILGQTLLSIPVKNSQQQSIDVSSLVSGIYNVYIEFENGTVIRKLEVIK